MHTEGSALNQPPIDSLPTVASSETTALTAVEEFPQSGYFVEEAPADLPVRRSAATFTPTPKRTNVPRFGRASADVWAS